MVEALQHQQLALRRQCSGHSIDLAGPQPFCGVMSWDYSILMQTILGRDIACPFSLQNEDFILIALYTVNFLYSIRTINRLLH